MGAWKHPSIFAINTSLEGIAASFLIPSSSTYAPLTYALLGTILFASAGASLTAFARTAQPLVSSGQNTNAVVPLRSLSKSVMPSSSNAFLTSVFLYTLYSLETFLQRLRRSVTSATVSLS